MDSAKGDEKTSEAAVTWWWQPFHQFRADMEHLDTLLSVAIDAVSREPFMAEWLSKYEDIERQYGPPDRPVEGSRATIEAANARAAFAKSEIEGGFSRFHALGSVAIYSALEAHVENILVAWMGNRPGAWELEEVAKIKVSLAEYERMLVSERHLYIVEQLESALRSPLRDGVSQFEVVLSVFGLGGEVDDETRKDLFELGQIRNVLMHRGGVADRKLCSSCPWLTLQPGEKVIVSREAYRKYLFAAHDYSYAIGNRIRGILGLPVLGSSLRGS